MGILRAWTFASLVACLSSTTFAQEYCDKFIVLDQKAATTDRTTFDIYRQVLSSDMSSTQSQDSQRAVNAGITIPVQEVILGLTFGDKSSSSNYQAWKNAFVNSTYEQDFEQLHASSASKIFGENSRKAVEACLASGKPYGYFQIVNDEGDAFVFKYSSGDIQEKILSARVTPAKNLADCEPTNPFGRPPSDTTFDLTGKGTRAEFSCTRTPASQAIEVTLNLAHGGQVVYSLPPSSPVKKQTASDEKPRKIFVYSTWERYDKNDPHTWYPPAHSMREQIVFKTPADMTCRIEAKAGGYTLAIAQHPPETECPDMGFLHGEKGKQGKFEQLGYKADYNPGDNIGYCSYAYSCTQDGE